MSNLVPVIWYPYTFALPQTFMVHLRDEVAALVSLIQTGEFLKFSLPTLYLTHLPSVLVDSRHQNLEMIGWTGDQQRSVSGSGVASALPIASI